MSNGSVSSPSVFRLGGGGFVVVLFWSKRRKRDNNIRNMLIAEIHVFL